ncbi:WhiB family transcriptional regulator [Tsukamurella tyrosinosolvens]|uniref:WhiB family transcriptional regulator n=1 Tax=Tsukamurella tyrosinosolvens TaxID=57704 RepID=UPI00398C0374
MIGWRGAAACADRDAELWFPAERDGRTQRAPSARAAADAREHEALQICHTCPVILECRSYALRTGQEFGIWGGLTSENRAQLARRPA